MRGRREEPKESMQNKSPRIQGQERLPQPKERWGREGGPDLALKGGPKNRGQRRLNLTLEMGGG